MKGNIFSGKHKRLLENVFFSNYFYGLCVVALSVEASKQQKFPTNNIFYHLVIFFGTVLYYGYPYIRKSRTESSHPRTNWFNRHYKLMRMNQLMITAALIISFGWFIFKFGNTLLYMPLLQWGLILIFPLVAGFYYGCSFLTGRFNLRKIGWLKPFIIGFTWAGLVTIYPVLFYDVMHKLNYRPTLVGGLLFLKNFMFISVLSILFDIKDYASDCMGRLNTFVVEIGLRKTIFYILLPLSLLGLLSFLYYAISKHFPEMKILLNVIPFILLILVIYSMRKRRSILYYLGIIDGLMLVKAVSGTIAMVCFS